MGVVSPNGIGRPAFCRAVLDGKSGVKRITRFDASASSVQIAGEVQDFDEFAWITPHERKHVGRVVPLCVAASSEAITDAGLQPEHMSMDEKREIGVVIGTGAGAQEFSEEQYRLWHSDRVKQVSLFCIPSGTLGTLSSEISMRFGFRGLSHVISTSCTSSTDAIGYALMQIRLGIHPVMLVGGVDAPITPGIFKGYTLLRALTTKWNHAPERASRPFSADRDGFVISEGSWMFVLEEYEHARARGVRIYAELAGYGSTCEAFHRVRLDESGEEPARAMQLAMQGAGIGPEDVHYVNLHGTSTELNDRIETRALKLVLNGRSHEVPMSALKSQIGHAQGACGAAGVAASLVAMEHSQVPPTVNLEIPDPACDLDYVPEAGRKASIEHAICNCIAFGSKNSAIVLRKI